MKKLLFFIFIFSLSNLYAQKKLTIFIKDTNNHPVYGVNLIIKNSNDEIKQSFLTDKDGKCNLIFNKKYFSLTKKMDL